MANSVQAAARPSVPETLKAVYKSLADMKEPLEAHGALTKLKIEIFYDKAGKPAKVISSMVSVGNLGALAALFVCMFAQLIS
jgi:hypothetical protein